MGHHIYTNVFEVDPDLPAVRQGDLRMIVPAQVGTGMPLIPACMRRCTSGAQ